MRSRRGPGVSLSPGAAPPSVFPTSLIASQDLVRIRDIYLSCVLIGYRALESC